MAREDFIPENASGVGGLYSYTPSKKIPRGSRWRNRVSGETVCVRKLVGISDMTLLTDSYLGSSIKLPMTDDTAYVIVQSEFDRAKGNCFGYDYVFRVSDFLVNWQSLSQDVGND